jgi:hypothetical protein
VHTLADVKGELNALFRELGPLIAEANTLVSMGHSLDVSAAEKSEARSAKTEFEEYQKTLNQFNGELNELSRHPDSQRLIACYLDNYYAESPRSASEGDTSSVDPVGELGPASASPSRAEWQARMVQLQDAAQEYQMKMQMQKMKHDLAMSAIRNFRM